MGVNKKAAPKKAVVFVEKQVGGAKNGGTRMVRAKKLANDYPTVDAAPKGTSVNFFSKHKRFPTMSTTNTSPEPRPRREPRRTGRSLTPRKRNTNPPSRGRRTRSPSTLRFSPLSRRTRRGQL